MAVRIATVAVAKILTVNPATSHSIAVTLQDTRVTKATAHEEVDIMTDSLYAA